MRIAGTTAAEELFVSPGAVSRHVANLEAFLGQSLFKRGRNEVRLTDAGAAYLTRVQDALDAIEDASDPTVTTPGSQKLHINSLPTVTERWLIPRLHDFVRLHPETSIRISTSMEETDWDTDKADVSIYASLDGVVERGSKLFTSRMAPVCSPEYASRIPTRQSPGALQSATLIASSSHRSDWQRWFHAAGLRTDNAIPQLIFGTSALAYSSAIKGLGVVCAECELIQD